MTRTDRAALKLAIELTRKESAARAQQIDAMLRDRPWEAVAKFASGCAQNRALRLKPWELAPVNVGPGDVGAWLPHHRADAAYGLQQRMLKLGVSKFHPNPLQAIEAAGAPGRVALLSLWSRDGLPETFLQFVPSLAPARFRR